MIKKFQGVEFKNSSSCVVYNVQMLEFVVNKLPVMQFLCHPFVIK